MALPREVEAPLYTALHALNTTRHLSYRERVLLETLARCAFEAGVLVRGRPMHLLLDMVKLCLAKGSEPSAETPPKGTPTPSTKEGGI